MSISLIPDTAPFTEEQRAWLNGFLAGWTGIVGSEVIDGSASNGVRSSGIASATTPFVEATDPLPQEEDFPWHDPAIEMNERLELAKGHSIERQLMAAMAQLDCGACGYVCQTYSEAIAAGHETKLTLCSPGGKETAKILKKLLKEAQAGHNGFKPSDPILHTNGLSHPLGNAPRAMTPALASTTVAQFSRLNPYPATVRSVANLNGSGSVKHTSHVVIDLGDSGIDYKVGDSLGVFPTNCTELVDDILRHIDCQDYEYARTSLIDSYCLRTVTDELLELLASTCDDPVEKNAIRSLLDSDELDEMDVLDALRRFPSLRLPAQGFLDTLVELSPRLYSIASSHRAHPGEVHLTVGRVATTIGDRTYKGVASTMFADRIHEGEQVRVYVQPSHGFTIPADHNAPAIMVGPGTGIAPFRAFLEERSHVGATGKNWLFFGDQHEATDFLYQTELEEQLARGTLTRLSLAFSRDQQQKCYVQDRMRQEGQELFTWLEAGAYLFVCGDAKRMAADVDRTLCEIVQQHGGKTPAEANVYVGNLKVAGRYLRDVY